VTRSKTGLPNVVADVKRQGIKELDAVYVTRCYSTRHGAGPFGDPLSLYFTQHIVDETNVPNPWQGTIRYSALNFDELKKFIMADLARVEGMKINPVLAVTCLDQMDKMPVIIDGEIHILPRADFLKVLQTFLPVKYVSFGPERRNVDRLF
jgi:adenylosuccinate synthase